MPGSHRRAQTNDIADIYPRNRYPLHFRMVPRKRTAPPNALCIRDAADHRARRATFRGSTRQGQREWMSACTSCFSAPANHKPPSNSTPTPLLVSHSSAADRMPLAQQFVVPPNPRTPVFQMGSSAHSIETHQGG